MKATTSVLVALAAAAGVSGSIYAAVVRPRIRRWGATDDEARAPLPGDEVARSSEWGNRLISTRAITIEAPPKAVWPWLVQIGSGRAGFYTHEWVERLLGITYADGHSAIRIHPEFQELHVGDLIPYSRFNKIPVVAMDPPHLLIAGEWFVLQPVDSGTRTRLLLRTRGGWLEPFAKRVPVIGAVLWPMAALIDRGPGELLHHYMEKGMVNSIKARVEELADRARTRQALAA
jgi:hypothetical protein